MTRSATGGMVAEVTSALAGPAAGAGVVGIGIDAVDIDRFRTVLDRRPRLTRRLFTDGERRYADLAPDPVPRLATRFATKEAFSKAVGTGFKQGVFLKDIGVVNAPSGAPTLALTGGALARLDALVPAGHVAKVHLTLTDDHPWAFAMVMIEALRAGES